MSCGNRKEERAKNYKKLITTYEKKLNNKIFNNIFFMINYKHCYVISIGNQNNTHKLKIIKN